MATVITVDCILINYLLGPKQNLDHRSFFSFGRYVNEFIQIIISHTPLVAMSS